VKFIASLILLCLVGFTGTALAADIAADPVTSEVLRQIFDAVMRGQWWAAAAASVIGVCALVRHYMPASWKDGARGDVVGTATAFVISFAGAILTWAVAPDATMSSAVAIAALKIGFAAVGGYTVAHKVIGWLVAWGKLPAWATTVLGLIATVIGSSAVKKAEAAGAAAVAAAPAAGMAGAGTIREID
jgi:hypothetical protein